EIRWYGVWIALAKAALPAAGVAAAVTRVPDGATWLQRLEAGFLPFLTAFIVIVVIATPVSLFDILAQNQLILKAHGQKWRRDRRTKLTALLKKINVMV